MPVASSLDKKLKAALMEHLSLKRKGDMVRIMWDDTVISEVNIRDIDNQIVGDIYRG